MIEIALTRAQQDIVDTWLDLLFERAVATDTQTQVRTIIAYHIDLRCRQLVAILLIHPTLDRLDDFRIVEAVDMVVASEVATIGTEVATIEASFEGHAEIITLRIERRPKVDELFATDRQQKDIQASHAWMSVRGEIQVAIRTEGSEEFIARGIDGMAQILRHTYLVV